MPRNIQLLKQVRKAAARVNQTTSDPEHKALLTAADAVCNALFLQYDPHFDLGHRKPKGIVDFGNGVHKCVGGNLARLGLRTVLEEWFRRIPSFTIKAGDKPRTMTGHSQGMSYLPLVWPVKKANKT